MSSDKLILSLLLLCVALIGCVSSDRDGSSGSERLRDGWYNEPKSFPEYLHIEGQLLDPKRVFEVRAEFEGDAEKMLESAPVVEVDVETAKRMAGDGFREFGGLNPYLARGLYYSKGTGRWRVHELGDKLQVAHFSLGKGQTTMHRQPLILLLKKKPVQVYTFCGESE